MVETRLKEPEHLAERPPQPLRLPHTPRLPSYLAHMRRSVRAAILRNERTLLPNCRCNRPSG